MMSACVNNVDVDTFDKHKCYAYGKKSSFVDQINYAASSPNFKNIPIVWFWWNF